MSVRLRVALLAFAGTALPATAFGQAWVGDKGETSFSLDYSFVTSDQLRGGIDPTTVGAPASQQVRLVNHDVVLGAEYNPIDRLGITAELPFLAVKYNDPKYLPHGTYDDGSYHETLQDLAVRARYQLVDELFAFAPHVGVSIPVADYESKGAANAGRHLKTLLVGASFGRFLDPVLDRGFVHLRYELGIPESAGTQKVGTMSEDLGKFSQLRSDVSLQLGYFFTPQLNVDLAADLHLQHGGLNFKDASSWTSVEATYHDRILNESSTQVGADLGWYFTEKARLNALIRIVVAGDNTRNAKSFGLGLSYDLK